MHVPSCFPVKENTWGVGFRLRRPPAKQQGSGSQRQLSPALPDVQWRAGCLNGLRCFPEQRCGGAGVCCPKSVSSPFADCSAQELGWCRWGDGASGLSGPAGLGGHCWVFAQKAFTHPIMLPRKGEYIGCGFQAPETPSKERAQGARGSPSPLFPTSSGSLGAKTACVTFLSKGAVGLVCAARGAFPVPL